MLELAAVQKLIDSLFPGLMGVRLTEIAADRVVAQLDVRPDLCTAVVTQTQLVLDRGG